MCNQARRLAIKFCAGGCEKNTFLLAKYLITTQTAKALWWIFVVPNKHICHSAPLPPHACQKRPKINQINTKRTPRFFLKNQLCNGNTNPSLLRDTKYASQSDRRYIFIARDHLVMFFHNLEKLCVDDQ